MIDRKMYTVLDVLGVAFIVNCVSECEISTSLCIQNLIRMGPEHLIQ